MGEVSQSDIFVRGRNEYGLFRAVFFSIMPHLSDTSAGFGREGVRRKFLLCKAGERLFRLIRVGDEVLFGATFGQVFRIPT